MFVRGAIFARNLDSRIYLGLSGHRIREFSLNQEKNLELLAKVEPLPIAELKQRAARGDRVVVAQNYNNKIVGYVWLGTKGRYIDHICREIFLKKEDVYIFNAYVIPDYRGHKTLAYMLAYISDTLRREGYERMWAGVDWENLPSLLSLRKIGFVPVRMIVIAKLGNKSFIVYHGVPKGTDQRLASASRSILGIR